VIGGYQMLVPVLDPFDGPPQSHCRDADKKIFGVELAANPEPAAGIAFLQHHRARAAAEHARHGVAVAVRYLGRAVQFQHVTGGVEASEGLPAYCAAERWKSGKRP
jgi:hypothetical protein